MGWHEANLLTSLAASNRRAVDLLRRTKPRCGAAASEAFKALIYGCQTCETLVKSESEWTSAHPSADASATPSMHPSTVPSVTPRLHLRVSPRLHSLATLPVVPCDPSRTHSATDGFPPLSGAVWHCARSRLFTRLAMLHAYSFTRPFPSLRDPSHDPLADASEGGKKRTRSGLIHILPDLIRMSLSEPVCNTARGVEAPSSRMKRSLAVACRNSQIQPANRLDCRLHPHRVRDCQALVGDKQFFRETPTHEGAPYRTAQNDGHFSASRTLMRNQIQLIDGEPTCASSTSKKHATTTESAEIAKVESKACGITSKRTRGVRTSTDTGTLTTSAPITRRSRPLLRMNRS